MSTAPTLITLTSIDITMYELADTTAQQILADRAAAGLAVRVILDQNLEKTNNTAAFTFLQRSGVQVVWANPTFAATHQKTITIDRANSAIMTLNLTSQYYATSRDFALLTSSPANVSAIVETFNADFTAAAIHPPTAADLVWSPTNATSSLVHLIHSAQHTLAIENKEMADPEITSALATAAKRGVAVHITMSANPAYNDAFQTLTTAGAEIRTFAQTDPLYIHAKIILADAGQLTARAFLGSENFSTDSLTRNRELGILLTDTTSSNPSAPRSHTTSPTPIRGTPSRPKTSPSPSVSPRKFSGCLSTAPFMPASHTENHQQLAGRHLPAARSRYRHHPQAKSFPLTKSRPSSPR